MVESMVNPSPIPLHEEQQQIIQSSTFDMQVSATIAESQFTNQGGDVGISVSDMRIYQDAEINRAALNRNGRPVAGTVQTTVIVKEEESGDDEESVKQMYKCWER